MGPLSIKRFASLANGFRKDARGNVAIIFTLVAIPLVALVGAAVDYTRVSSARTAMQSALDSAALMISKDAATMSESEITTRARQYVNSLYTNTETPIQSFSVTYTPNTGSGASIVLNADGNMPTYFMKIVGTNFSTLPIKTASTTKWGSTRMRVALVLDNTGSMSSNGKMTALKNAATDMITKLSAFNTAEGDVYISIVPFAKDVNVDISTNLNASWLNWSEWEAEPPYLVSNGYPNNWTSTGPGSNCPFTNNNHGFTCMDRPATSASAKSTNSIPSSGTYSGMICPSIDSGKKLPGKTDIYYNGCYDSIPTISTTSTIVDSGNNASCGNRSNCTCTGSGNRKVCTQTSTTAGAPYTHNWVPNNKSTWTGCVNDRDQTLDVTNDAISGSGRVYPEQWKDCLPATITAMSNSWSNLTTQINNMTPSGNTNQAIGLFWGWQTLNTTSNPYQAPAKDPNWVYKDYIVLLSDGMNTQNRWSKTQSTIDNRQATLCQNIKDKNKNGGNQITVFTIQVNINSKDPTSTVLKNCATSGEGFFQLITSADETATAFQNVLNKIAKLRIAQ